MDKISFLIFDKIQSATGRGRIKKVYTIAIFRIFIIITIWRHLKQKKQQTIFVVNKNLLYNFHFL